jgi:hypothetical protein
VKRTVEYIIISILVIIHYSCQKPSPTELVSNNSMPQDNVTVSIVQNEPNTFEYSNGYDSTGIISPEPKYTSLITVSSVTTSNKSTTANSYLARAIFYDKTKPINLVSGRTIGFGTRNMGIVQFGNHFARLTPLLMKIKHAARDSVIGNYYLLYRKNNFGDPFEFDFNSKIDFRLKIMGNPAIYFQIPTPVEISGIIESSGSITQGNLKYTLKWNGINDGKIDIIIGGIMKGHNKAEVSPYLNLRTEDDGDLKLPVSLLKNFPFNQFDRIVFTFIRKKVVDKFTNSTLEDNYIAAYSIHNIQMDIPL